MTIKHNYNTDSKKSQEKYTMTIGIECHVQLATNTKLFSSADNDARNKLENTCLSYVDLALPGALPVLNQQAVVLAIRASKALNAKLNPLSSFDRKHYFYPDLPKGYQTTQNYQPIIGAGHIELPDGSKIRIEHAHLEEDAGKLTHYSDHSLVDLNRAGTPLLEIVSMPDIHSAKHAHDYCKELWRALTFAKITYGDLYHGNMRFDVNISLAPTGSKTLGTRAEIKNLNSFRSVERAVEYEFLRQSKLLDQGEKIVQETRGWSDDTGKTTSQRAKASAADYRYLPDPDLPPLELSSQFIEQSLADFPLLPADFRRLLKPHLPTDNLETLLDYPDLIQKLASLNSSHSKILKKLSNLFVSVLLAEENRTLLNQDLPTDQQLIDLIDMNDRGELSSSTTKELFLILFDPKNKNSSTLDLAKANHLLQENDTVALEAIVDQVLSDPATAKAQADYRAGEHKTLGFLVGQVMKASKGTANPSSVSAILLKKLNS